MVLSQFFAIILISFGAAAIYLAISALRPKFRDYIGNIILGLICLASAIWSYGFGLVFVQHDTSIAFAGRSFGMVGVFLYMILAQFLVNSLTKLPKYFSRYTVIFSFLGIPIYFLTVSRSAVMFIYSNKGMTYIFKPGFTNTLYSVYSVIYAINMFITVVIAIRSSQTHREKYTAINMLLAILVIAGGMVLDTVFPTVGLDAIPGSTLTQFIGLLVIYYAIVDYNKTRITILNMSSYIYYSTSEPILVFDNSGNFMLSNEAAFSIFPELKEIDRKNKYKINRLFNISEDYLDQIQKNKISGTYTLENNTPVELNTNRIFDKYQDSIGFIVTVKDMTKINAAMDSLKYAKEEADKANIAKSAFLANMSHEIRTPLNAIVGFSELLLKDDLSDESKDQAEDIRSSAQNLLAIINDILDISKIESGKMELVNDKYKMSNILKDVYLITETLTKKKGLNFKIDIDENIPDSLYGDAVRVRGILVNVLNNAVKYTKEGSVTLKGYLESITEEDVELRFEIIDTGIGIKEKDIANLFDSFSQVDKKINSGIEGTGLGLAIVKGYIDLMNGSVDVKSVYGEGSTFILIFHQKLISREPVIGKITLGESSNKIVSNIGNIQFKGLNVLSVDDSRMNLKLVEKSLTKYAINVTSVPSGAKAIELCRENEYDAILMDQMMPEMDGITAMKEIRKLSPYYTKGGKCIIIALTANAILGVKEELINEGFDNYLSKPMNFKDVESVFSEYFTPTAY